MTAFTASSGHLCKYEIVVPDDGQVNVNVLWIGEPPTPEDLEEFAGFIEKLVTQAQLPHLGAPEHYNLGEIKPEDVSRVREIIEERMKKEGL